MKFRFYITVIALCLIWPFAVQAKKHTKIKSAKCYVHLINAYKQRTLPGVRGAQPIEQYHFLIVWKNNEQPGAIFWRGANGWMSCNIQKAHFENKKDNPNKLPYTASQFMNGDAHKGDTLALTPLKGKFVIPAEIPMQTTNTLFFKTAKGKWLSLPVANIKNLPDIVMP